MSAWKAVIPNSFGMFLTSDAVDKPLRPMANRFGGCFCLGSGPVCGVLVVFCCLLRFFRWRNASLAGGFAGRRFWLAVVVFSFVLFLSICRLSGLLLSLYKGIFCLFAYKDRAFSATSAKLEEKNQDKINKKICWYALHNRLSLKWPKLFGRVS